MSEENKAPAKEKPAKQPKAKPVKTKEAAPRRRERPIDAKDVFVPGSESGEAGMNDIFRMRLAYLMNGNNAQGKNLVHALVFHNVSSLKSGSLYAESPFLYHSRFFRQDIKLKHTDNIGNISP